MKPMTAEQKYDMMTRQPIPRIITRMAVPSIISMLVTSLYNMADTFFIGRLNNTSATGAISVVFPLMSIIQAIGFMLGHGSGNTISRQLGQKDADGAAKTAATGFLMAWIVGFVFSVVCLISRNPLMRLLGATETILPYAVEYGSYIMIGAPWMLAAIVLNVQMRFQGNAFFSMIGIATGAVLNVALDPVFIYALDMGVAGAALATIISQGVSCCLLFAGTFRGGNIRIHLRNFSPTVKTLKPIFMGGMPSLCRQGLGSVSSILMNVAASTYGGVTPEAIDAAVAAIGIVNRMMQFCASAIIGFGQGFQPVCGFNYGAKKYGRVRQGYFFTLKVMFVAMLVISVIGLSVSSFVIEVFSTDPAVIAFGVKTLRFQCAVFPLMSLVFSSNMAMQTMGMALRASILAMARNGVCFIPMILILPPLFGALGVQMSQAAADVLAMALSLPMILPVLKMLKEKDAQQQESGAENV